MIYYLTFYDILSDILWYYEDSLWYDYIFLMTYCDYVYVFWYYEYALDITSLTIQRFNIRITCVK